VVPDHRPDNGAQPAAWRDRLELIARGEPLGPLRAVAALAALAGLVLVGWLLLRDPAAPVESTLPMAGASGAAPDASPGTTSTSTPTELVVHASGAVRNPGLYRVPKGARVADVVQAAGGPVDGADLDRINLAAPVADGAQIRILRIGEAAPAGGATGGDAGHVDGGPVNLNTASAAELEALPGVGPATASAIVEARGRRAFRTVDDLLDVPGIGPAKLGQLRDLVRV
jgi:competence protein ComEA